MHMMPLPFSDDFRYPESDQTVVGSNVSVASDAHIGLAQNLVERISLSADFISSNVPNPAIQRHYEVIEVRNICGGF